MIILSYAAWVIPAIIALVTMVYLLTDGLRGWMFLLLVVGIVALCIAFIWGLDYTIKWHEQRHPQAEKE